MKRKYIDDRYKPIFGIACTDGTVCVTNAEDSISIIMSKEDAESLIAEFNRIQDALADCAMAFDEAGPDAFNLYWYGNNKEIPK